MISEAEVYRDLTAIFHNVLMREDLTLTAGLSARQVPGWDSIKQIEILLACEEKWGIRFTTREIDALRNVGDLAGTVLKKLQ